MSQEDNICGIDDFKNLSSTTLKTKSKEYLIKALKHALSVSDIDIKSDIAIIKKECCEFMPLLKAEIAELRSKHDDLVLRVDTITAKLDSKYNEIVTANANDKNSIFNIKNEMELIDRKLRSKNVIISGLDEKFTTGTSIDLLGKALKCNLENMVVDSRRLGHKINGKTRNILLQLASESQKYEIFSKAKLLRDHSELGKVYLR